VTSGELSRPIATLPSRRAWVQAEIRRAAKRRRGRTLII
jgi:hypothetical protein